MFRLKALTLFAIPVVLTTVLWVVAVPAADVIDDDLARLIGFLLLGIAVLSIVLVFRSAVATPIAVTPCRVHSTAPGSNEFRRGFVSTKAAPRKQRTPRPSEVIALRRHRIEPRIGPIRPAVVPAHAPQTIETLKRRLQDRAEQLWKQRAG